MSAQRPRGSPGNNAPPSARPATDGRPPTARPRPRISDFTPILRALGREAAAASSMPERPLGLPSSPGRPPGLPSSPERPPGLPSSPCSFRPPQRQSSVECLPDVLLASVYEHLGSEDVLGTLARTSRRMGAQTRAAGAVRHLRVSLAKVGRGDLLGVEARLAELRSLTCHDADDYCEALPWLASAMGLSLPLLECLSITHVTSPTNETLDVAPYYARLLSQAVPGRLVRLTLCFTHLWSAAFDDALAVHAPHLRYLHIRSGASRHIVLPPLPSAVHVRLEGAGRFVLAAAPHPRLVTLDARGARIGLGDADPEDREATPRRRRHRRRDSSDELAGPDRRRGSSEECRKWTAPALCVFRAREVTDRARLWITPHDLLDIKRDNPLSDLRLLPSHSRRSSLR